MKVSTLAWTAFAGFAAAAPYNPFPLKDGFPSPSAKQLSVIENLAGGALPGGPLASSISDTAATTLRLLALNELFEVAYFNMLLDNLVHNRAGYDLKYSSERNYIIKTITAIKNQEELHAAGVNAALAAANRGTVAPCSYNIPVKSYAGAIQLANIFTDVVLGALPQAQFAFASDPRTLPYVPLFGSVIAQEAEQNGWFRYSQGKLPSAAPFLTTEGPSFAFTFLTAVIAPGCPGVDLVKQSIPTFGKLNVLSAPSNRDVPLTFSVAGQISSTSNSIVYLTGHNLPVSAEIYGVQYKNGVSTFKALFPWSTQHFSKGLSIAAVVNTGVKQYSDLNAVAAATVYGPGIIEEM